MSVPFEGWWQVVGVRVYPANVTAHEEDDPEFMGAVLTISSDEIAWLRPTRSSMEANCRRPTFHPARVPPPLSYGPDDYERPRAAAGRDGLVVLVRCDPGPGGQMFGHESSLLYEMMDGRIGLVWYNGIDLILASTDPEVVGARRFATPAHSDPYIVCYRQARTDQALGACALEEAERIDERIGEAHRATAAPLDARSRRQLRAVHRAWLNYRRTECRWRHLQAAGTDRAGEAFGFCMKDLGEARLSTLGSG